MMTVAFHLPFFTTSSFRVCPALGEPIKALQFLAVVIVFEMDV